MIKRNFTNIIIVAIIAASLLFAGIAQQPVVVSAEDTEMPKLSDYAGIAAYTQITDSTFSLDSLKPVFQMIEYEEADFIVGTLDMPIYEPIYDPLVLVTSDGWIVAFYPNTDPAGKIVDVISKNLDETLLQKAINIVADAAGVVMDPVNNPISHYDFRNPYATNMLLVAEYEPDGNDFTLLLDQANLYYEKSYAFYRTFSPSFTIDNETMDQVNFVIENADYIGLGYYGSIYGHFSTINIDTGIEYSFAVEAGDDLGFGSLAIVNSGSVPINIENIDIDFAKQITLATTDINPSFDFTPIAPDKIGPSDLATDIGLAPTLSWNVSTAPNYEYCIDITNDNLCDTEWINVGSQTSVALSDLFYETTYYWQVRAINSFATVEADEGAWFSFTTADGVAPQEFIKFDFNLKEPTDSLSKVTMTWTPSYGAYYYEVCVDETADCIAPELWHNVGLGTRVPIDLNGDGVEDEIGLTATMGDLLLDSTYNWQVRAWNGFNLVGEVEAGYYTYADSGTWQTFDTRTFGKLRPLDNATHNLTLPFKWEATPIATNGYEYCIVPPILPIDPDDGPSPNIAACDWKKVTGTSVVVRKLTAGTYFWQVRTFGSNEEADDGDWWKFTVLSKKDVTKLTFNKLSPLDEAMVALVDLDVNGSIDPIGLSWKTLKNAISYQYCFFPIDDTDTTPISEDDTCTYEDENWHNVDENTSTTISELLETTTYLWQVRANLGTTETPLWVYADKEDYWSFTTFIPIPE